MGAGRFDFVADVGEQVPMRTISMLLGIPESDQEEVRDQSTGSMRTEPGEPMEIKQVGNPRCTPSTSTGGPVIPPTTS